MANYTITTYDDLKQKLKDSSISTEQFKTEIFPNTLPEVLRQYVNEYPVGVTSSYASEILNGNQSNLQSNQSTSFSTSSNDDNYSIPLVDPDSQNQSIGENNEAFAVYNDGTSIETEHNSELDWFSNFDNNLETNNNDSNESFTSFNNETNEDSEKAWSDILNSKTNDEKLKQAKTDNWGLPSSNANEQNLSASNQAMAKREKIELDKMIQDDKDAGSSETLINEENNSIINQDTLLSDKGFGKEPTENLDWRPSYMKDQRPTNSSSKNSMVDELDWRPSYMKDQKSLETSNLNSEDNDKLISFLPGSFSNGLKNVVYNVSEAVNLYDKILSLQGNVSSIKKNVESVRDGVRGNLNPETLSKIDLDSLFDSINKNIDNWSGVLSELLSKTNKIENKAEAINSSGVGSSQGGVSRIHSKGSSNSGTTVESTTIDTPTEELIINTQTNVINPLFSSVIGGITFSEIVILYQEIGGNQISSSPTANYGLLNIIKKDDKYYYQIIDKESGEVYYTEINNKAKVESDYKNIVEVKQKAMMLSSPETDTNNFVKLADENSIYLSKDIVENQDLKFANILDTTDSNNYYIPVSDSINVISIASLTNSKG